VVFVRNDPATVITFAQTHGEAKIQGSRCPTLSIVTQCPTAVTKATSLLVVISTSVKWNVTGSSDEPRRLPRGRVCINAA
jgi:hypothetical protein